MNLPQFLLQKIEKTPDKAYLQFEQQRITYEELYSRIVKTASGFYEMGIRREDKVCIMLNNSPEYLDVWFGLSFLGAILVPLNIHLKGDGLRYILTHSDCKVIVAEEEYVHRIIQCLETLPKDLKIIIRGKIESVLKNLETKNIVKGSLEQLISNSSTQLPDLSVSPNDINCILYTSGTTGAPKGVMLSHAAYVNSAQSFASRMVNVQPDDILFTTLPLFHINAQAHTTLGAISANATIALSKKFSASRFWDEIRAHGATIFNSLGSMIPILIKQPEREDDRNNPARVTACAATPKEFWRTFEERFGVKIIEGYGLTETAGFCISNPIEFTRIPSIGKEFPYIKTKIVDENDNPVKTGEIGELLIKPLVEHSIMEGYYKMPEKTAETMKDGWFHTGDRVYEDEDGYLYFSDRLKQCIRRRGENISSWEIEKVVNQHPKVLESAAVGVPSEFGEEDVKIYFIL
jgi:crotonobetaine/carnitine-CoA ligase